MHFEAPRGRNFIRPSGGWACVKFVLGVATKTLKGCAGTTAPNNQPSYEHEASHINCQKTYQSKTRNTAVAEMITELICFEP